LSSGDTDDYGQLDRGAASRLIGDATTDRLIGHHAGRVQAPVIPFARQLRDTGGRREAVIVADVDPNIFSRFFNGLNLGARGIVTLSENRGAPLLTSTTAENAALNAPSVLVSSDGLTVLGASQQDANDHISTISQANGYPLSVSVGIDRRDVDREWLWGVAPAFAVLGAFCGVLITYARAIDRHRVDKAEALRRSIMAQKLESMGQMTASVAHDFRNILMAFKSAIQILRKRGPSPALFAEAEATLDRGNAMVDRLLACSRRNDLELESVDVNALIANLDTTLRHIAISPTTFRVAASIAFSSTPR
jgi:two-component system, NtrC family, sensor kinase